MGRHRRRGIRLFVGTLRWPTSTILLLIYAHCCSAERFFFSAQHFSALPSIFLLCWGFFVMVWNQQITYKLCQGHNILVWKMDFLKRCELLSTEEDSNRQYEFQMFKLSNVTTFSSPEALGKMPFHFWDMNEWDKSVGTYAIIVTAGFTTKTDPSTNQTFCRDLVREKQERTY